MYPSDTVLFLQAVQPKNSHGFELTSWAINPLVLKLQFGVPNQISLYKYFQLVDAASHQIVFSGNAGKTFGSYGPFTETYRLNFSSFKKSGKYYLQAGSIKSPVFTIAEDVYKGSADFCLHYMRQQRTGFNPFLKDSCHNA